MIQFFNMLLANETPDEKAMLTLFKTSEKVKQVFESSFIALSIPSL